MITWLRYKIAIRRAERAEYEAFSEPFNWRSTDAWRRRRVNTYLLKRRYTRRYPIDIELIGKGAAVFALVAVAAVWVLTMWGLS
ncbi:hypothetical protein FDH48_gp45 [Arthrobacter phage Jawnski]|uniref:Uncharacterized protein n=1 Tax=Arthrobacter phage Jawnski TaxID=1772327 RepID=A0A0U4B3T1_9CAUD|nr:hypothetical protein FDH48_gp45 [Arthrobacter phage Jawnski]ALY09374.1 hypothetical protein JAWNSKI_45 [Arthrobacter phage Jawnski]